MCVHNIINFEEKVEKKQNQSTLFFKIINIVKIILAGRLVGEVEMCCFFNPYSHFIGMHKRDFDQTFFLLLVYLLLNLQLNETN